MKYQTAAYLRSFVMALSVEAHNDDLCCALVQRPDVTEHWECHFFSRNGLKVTDMHFALLVHVILQFAPTLTWYNGKYDGGHLKGEKIYDSLVIW